MSHRTFIRLAAELPEADVYQATDHPAVTAVSVDRGPELLCRPCVEIDLTVAAMLDRAEARRDYFAALPAPGRDGA